MSDLSAKMSHQSRDHRTEEFASAINMTPSNKGEQAPSKTQREIRTLRGLRMVFDA